MKMMSKLFLSFILLLFFTCFLCNASNNNPSTEYDFGTIPSVHTVKHDFILPQKITSIVTLCECVKAKVQEEKDTQGLTHSTVHVEFDPSDYKGTVAEEILCVNSAGERITLRIKAFVQ
jgi:hypothetical protein